MAGGGTLGRKIGGFGATRTCACCLKEFYIPAYSMSEYLYKISVRNNYKYFCKYTCYKQGQDDYENLAGKRLKGQSKLVTDGGYATTKKKKKAGKKKNV